MHDFFCKVEYAGNKFFIFMSYIDEFEIHFQHIFSTIGKHPDCSRHITGFYE